MPLTRHQLLIIALLFALSSFLLPFLSIAADPSIGVGQPVGQGQFLPCTGSACKLTDLFQFIKNIINFFIRIAIPLGIGFTVYGAFRIMTAGGSEEAVKEGKKIITAAAIGIAIILASQLIVTTFIKLITGLQ